MKNGKELLKVLQSMSEEELENNFFDNINFNIADVNNTIDEISDNGLLGDNENDYDILENIDEETKILILKMLNQAVSDNSYRQEYITSVLDYIRYMLEKEVEKRKVEEEK